MTTPKPLDDDLTPLADYLPNPERAWCHRCDIFYTEAQCPACEADARGEIWTQQQEATP